MGDNGVLKEMEKPTETDARILHEKLLKPMEEMQAVFVSALKELEENGVETKGAYIKIDATDLDLHIGAYYVWRSVNSGIYYGG